MQAIYNTIMFIVIAFLLLSVYFLVRTIIDVVKKRSKKSNLIKTVVTLCLSLLAAASINLFVSKDFLEKTRKDRMEAAAQEKIKKEFEEQKKLELEEKLREEYRIKEAEAEKKRLKEEEENKRLLKQQAEELEAEKKRIQEQIEKEKEEANKERIKKEQELKKLEKKVLPLDIEGIIEEYNNLVANSGLETTSFDQCKRNTGEKEVYNCHFGEAGGMIISVIPNTQKILEILILTSSKDTPKMVGTTLAMFGSVTPSLSKDQRNSILKKLGIFGDITVGETRKHVYKGIKYSFSVAKGVGFILTLSKP